MGLGAFGKEDGIRSGDRTEKLRLYVKEK